MSKNRWPISRKVQSGPGSASDVAVVPENAVENHAEVIPVVTPTKRSESDRLLLIDALRGFAAMAVVLYHIYGNIAEETRQWIPQIVHGLFQVGFVGVPVFFVLSGFVISRATDKDEVTLAYVGRFMLKRAIRLDPPYWCAIAVAICLLVIKNKLFPQFAQSLPTGKDIVAHLFYLQDLLQLSPISAVFWTLCLEIQLYITYILLRCSRDYVARHIQLKADGLFIGMCLALGILSLAVDSTVISLPMKGLFVAFWHQFLLGVLANWATKDWITTRQFAACVAVIIAIQLLTAPNLNSIAAVATASFIVLAARMGHLHDWLKGAGIQYFGRISYSLYLLHPTIGWTTVSLGRHVLGPGLSPIGAILLFLAGIGSSVVAAHMLNILVERPSMSL